MANMGKREALAEFEADLEAGVRRTQREYAARWGVGRATVSRWIAAAWDAESPVTPAPSPRNSAPSVPPTPHADAVAHELGAIRRLLERIDGHLQALCSVEQNGAKVEQAGGASVERSMEQGGAKVERSVEQAPSERSEEGNSSSMAGSSEVARTEQGVEQGGALHVEQGGANGASGALQCVEQGRSAPSQSTLSLVEPRSRYDAPGPGSPLLRLLQGTPPPRLDGTKPASASEWLDENWPLLAAQVEADHGDDLDDRAFYRHLKALMIRFWKNRRPLRAQPGGVPRGTARAITGWQHG